MASKNCTRNKACDAQATASNMCRACMRERLRSEATEAVKPFIEKRDGYGLVRWKSCHEFFTDTDEMRYLSDYPIRMAAPVGLHGGYVYWWNLVDAIVDSIMDRHLALKG